MDNARSCVQSCLHVNDSELVLVFRPRAAEPPVDLRPPFDCVVIAGDEAQR